MPVPAGGAPDATEQALAASIDAQQPAAIALLERSVNVNSGTMNFAGVREVGALFRAEFDALGFRTWWIDGTPFGRAGHLVAEHTGRGPRVLLIGHLDTVFEPSSPFQKFERVHEDIARGPGTSDMKGGIVVALAALRALQAAGALDSVHITVVLTGDEEDTGEPLEAARAALIEAAVAADLAIGLENADDDPKTAVTARRSSSSWTLTVKAESAHSSQIFRDDVGAGAVFEAARILDAFRTRLQGEEYLTFNPGVVAGGSQLAMESGNLTGRVAGKSNIIASDLVVSGDLRALTLEQRERARTTMLEIAAQSLPHASAQLTFSDGYPPMAPTDGNRKLLGLYDQVSRDLGFGPVTAVDPRRAGAADISFAAAHVDMAIDGLGLLGGGNHTPDEFADLRTVRIQAQRLAVMLYRLGRSTAITR
jgi:glutamate carboxypeptidase